MRLVTSIYLQSIYVTRDCVIVKFEVRVQIHEAVLRFGCEIQNSGGNVVSFSKINSCEIFANFREIFRESFNILLECCSYKEDFECSFHFRSFRSRMTYSCRLTVKTKEYSLPR